jgi:hypothetical protein
MPLDINDAIQEVLALTGSELRQHAIAVRTDLSPEVRPVLGNRVQLQQELLNLITRARSLQVDSAGPEDAVRTWAGGSGGRATIYRAEPFSSAMGDSGAGESTIQDAGWTGGQLAWHSVFSRSSQTRCRRRCRRDEPGAGGAHYQVSHSSAIRWTKRQGQTGSPAALPMGGKKPFTLAIEEAWIRARVDQKPDITGRELLAELNQRGIEISYCGVWHFLDHVGLSFSLMLSTR